MKRDGGPAFPIRFQYVRHDGATITHEADGMSLLDYFATSEPTVPTDAWLEYHYGGTTLPIDRRADALAAWRYECARAMLRSREE